MNKHIKYILDNVEHPKWIDSNLQYVVITGSYAYNVNNSNSDMDLYAYAIPEKKILFPHTQGYIKGFGKEPEIFDQFQKHHIQNPSWGKEYDIQIFNIVKFFNLTMLGNPNMIDCLYVPSNCILHMTELGTLVRENRNLFLSKICKVKMSSYAYSELRKIESKAHSGSEKRKELIDKYGYDCKHAYHVIRLIFEAEQILEEHDLDLTRNSEMLKSIRSGNWTLEQIKAKFYEKEKHLEELYSRSTLRTLPAEEEIKNLLFKCLESHYGSLSKLEVEIPNAKNNLITELEKVLQKYR